MNINLTCSTDDKYLQHCAAMLCSVFDNNRTHEITVHLLHHNLSEKSIAFLTQLGKQYGNNILFYDVDEKKLENVSIAKNHPNLSIATYYRLFLPSLLDNSINRILYLDCDVIVLKDISNLFKLNLEEYGVAAVRDSTPWSDVHREVMGKALNSHSFCAGVLLINLKYWREHKCQDKMLQYADKMQGKLIMEDQDILNYVFHEKWFELPYKYGKASMGIAILDENQKWNDIKEYAFDPSIMHYATHVKPWLDIRIPDDRYYWKYVKLSGYPNPRKTKTLKQYRKSIYYAKIRYYINYFIRPFIPNTLEILFKDIINILKMFLYLYNINKFKEFRLKIWIEKYKKL